MLQAIRTNTKNQKGFTLVELMVVIAIIGILAAIAVPRFTASTAAARGAKVQADLRTLDSALMMYLAAHGGTLPAAGDTSAELIATTSPLVSEGFITAIPTPPQGAITVNNTQRGTPGTAYQFDVVNMRAQVVTTGTGTGTFTAEQL